METISGNFKNTKPITQLFNINTDFLYYKYFANVIVGYVEFHEQERMIFDDYHSVIDRVIGLLLKSDNILQLGYSNLCGKGGIISTGNIHYEIGFPNTLVSILKNKEWSELYHLIGQDNLTFLLLNCSIFVAVNTNVFQLCGPAFTNVYKRIAQNKEIPINQAAPMIDKPPPDKVNQRNIVHWQRVLYGNPTFSNGKINCKPNINFNIFKIKKKKRFEKVKDLVNRLENRHEKINYKELMNDDPKLFVYSVMKRLFPTSIFGSERNKVKIIKQINRLIDSTRYQISRISIDGIKLNEIEWLSTEGKQAPTDFIKKQELFSAFTSWLCDHFVINLLKANYYVTETSYLKNKLIYIKYADWKRMEYKLYSLTNFSRCDYQPSHSVRLLLKQNGARIINENIKDFGNSCFGKNDIFNRLLAIKKSLADIPEKLYFCKIDIQACFDTINQRLLLEIIEGFLKKPEYLIRKFSLINKRIEYKREAMDSNSFKDFHDFVLNSDIKDSIFVDAVNYQFESKEKIMELLTTHLLNHTIKIGRSCYRQHQGIPQGSVLSTLLCNLFYGKMENEKLQQFKNGLMRYVDDFLFVSKNKQEVIEFCNLMHSGFAEYGMTVNPSKTLLNFKHSKNGFEFKHSDSDWFPWCGLLVHSSTLEIPRFAFKVYFFCRYKNMKNRAHSLYYDCKLNSAKTILLNIYQTFIICAMRFGSYLHYLTVNKDFMVKVILESIDYQYAIVKTRSKIKLAKKEIYWMGLHAYIRILKRNYRQISNELLKDFKYSEKYRSLINDPTTIEIMKIKY
ncbi:hypothetical protein HDV01_005251 [Terramyces sp. JEL0728]|nr:hypothetical protein HDV01_005251 [Terramyces sp. JEL0728]